MSLAESTSAASEPSAVPSWPPNSALPSEETIAVIGPSCARICSGTSSPIDPTIRAATGSHSLRHTSSVVSSHSPRVQAAGAVIPDGSAHSGSSHRSARRNASATAARSAASTGGSPTGALSSPSPALGAGVRPGRAKPNGPIPCCWPPVRCAFAICRARSQLTGPPLAGALNMCCTWLKSRASSLGSGMPPSGRPKPKGGGGSAGTRQPYAPVAEAGLS